MFKILDDLVRTSWWVVFTVLVLIVIGIGRVGHRQIPLKVASIEAVSYDGNDYIFQITYENGKIVQFPGLDRYSVIKTQETGYLYDTYNSAVRFGLGFGLALFIFPIGLGMGLFDEWEFGNPMRFFITETNCGYNNYSTLVRIAGFLILLYYTIANFFGAKHKTDFNEILRNIK